MKAVGDLTLSASVRRQVKVPTIVFKPSLHRINQSAMNQIVTSNNLKAPTLTQQHVGGGDVDVVGDVWSVGRLVGSVDC